MAADPSRDPGGREPRDLLPDSVNTLQDVPRHNDTDQEKAKHLEKSAESETSKVYSVAERPMAEEHSRPPGGVKRTVHALPGILNVPLVGRNRGYSLRRTIFTRNVQDQAFSDQETFELDPPKADGQKDTAYRRPTTVTIAESQEETESPPQRPVRLSDAELKLPLYRHWMAKHSSRTTVLKKMTAKGCLLKDKIMRANNIPSSVDGRHVRVNVLEADFPVDERTGKPYTDNLIRSCRYTPWNFVPKQLMAQFGKLANFYFLCVAILQMIPGLSTTGTYTTIIPLLIFVALSMSKEGYDDIRRNRLDKEENERNAHVLRSSSSEIGNNEWLEKRWSEVRVGDAVLLRRDASVPADMVLLHVHEPAAFVETKGLDGETNLKSKQPLADVSAACGDPDSIARLAAEFVVEDPNLDLYKFDGRIAINGTLLPLTNSEILYRGSVLRNTPSAVGLVIYSGEECKIRMNANKTPRTKAPTLQAKVNRVVIFVASLVFFMAFILTGAYQIWRGTTEKKAWYLQDAGVPFGQILTSFIIMLNTMLPLSLYVSLEIVKIVQMFLMNDVDMYDAESDIPMEPHTSTINEELGQVSYIFSDKTGTLTNNSMKFRKMSIAGTAWLHDIDLQEEAADQSSQQKLRHKKRGGKGKEPQPEKNKRKSLSWSLRKSTTSIGGRGEPHQSRNSDAAAWKASNGLDMTFETGKTEQMLDYIYRRPNTVFARKARFFLLSLALCHTCIPEKDNEGEISYQAASPDELALVTAAQDLGHIVTDRQTNTVTTKTYADGDEASPFYETYEILDVIDFSSARKRMSIVVRFPDKRICLISKGADSTIKKLLRLADLAATNAQAAERRANQRKSIDAQEVLRRRSTQMSQRTSLPHGLDASSPRPSGLSFDCSRSARDSVDQWLKERENEARPSRRRRSSQQFYSARPSLQLPTRRSDTLAGRAVRSPQITPRASMQVDGSEELVEESLVIDENAVFERCFQHIDDFATEGLRTLLYAFRYLSDNEYGEWKQIYLSATTSITDRQDKIERAAELLETKLELLGATAIEDKLQKGVPDAVDRFRRAGIKIWMLTGDKRETAINIGHSCRLIKDYSTIIVLDHELGNLNDRMATSFAQMNEEKTAHSVLVIDGQTLTFLEVDSAAMALFTDIAIRADSVICCRASPSQKASLVRTIRTKVKGSVTLAIGDGANDIAMIQEAHLGIGIAGKEGLQAARTSDYSIAQFRFLLKLLLVHGRWNYIRICKYLLGTLWKEMMFYLAQALYQRWNGYTGTSLYEPWSMSMFNTLFTSLPVIFMGVFEKDLAASTLLAVPELYNIGIKNRGFNFWIYIRWSVLAACEAVLVYFLVQEIYGLAWFTKDQELYAFGDLVFSICIIVISLKMQFIELHNKSVTAAIAIFLSIGGWWLWNLVLSCIYQDNRIYSVKRAFLDRFGRNLLWWVTLILTVAAVCLVEMTIKTVKAAFWPSDVDAFQGLEQDREVRKRFEEAAADLLQQGWDRGTKRSSLDIASEEAEQADREAQVEELLNRPREMPTKSKPKMSRNDSRFSTRSGTSIKRQQNQASSSHEMTEVQQSSQGRKSIDIGDLFSKGYGAVRRS